MMKIGFLGIGNMGMAIAQGAFLKQLYRAEEIGVFDHNPENMKKAQKLGFTLFESETDCAEHSEIVFLAIKPQGFEELLQKISVIQNQPLLVSIAAGIPMTFIERFFDQAKVIRTMPNTPLMIGEGATAMCRNGRVSDESFHQVQILFETLGKCEVIEESQMNTIITVNGSTPAYVYYFIDCLAKDAAARGVDYDLAVNLAAQTFIGAAKLLMQDQRNADELIDMVCSKGGTTIEAMNVLRSQGIDKLIHNANEACINRAIEMQKEFGN